ncbi:hypothetical protein H6F44_22685 [Pseudanabaena sp. FACHB-1277]|uniref:Uncharacterized protein n=1 Tax=Pseudanabaena cinerea FACHB-1277 TaxID=2949581 RepID=A0A926UXI6_9CYAN|nr:hypothetical protein [Pseudanabaena cinerea]MBD2152894.1 hypothetical protein [Pseudanabaena cinerea FACHB-1277]
MNRQVTLPEAKDAMPPSIRNETAELIKLDLDLAMLVSFLSIMGMSLF